MLQISEGLYKFNTSTQHSHTNSSLDDQLKDMCPICKTDKYLSPNMKFLINPECYHKICESCVDRIFSLGPAPCPYPKCGKILRKNKFKQQIFENLVIEKEIDIRRKVGAIYNKTEEDFPDLKEYNQYLENIEDIVFKLSNGIDVEQTEAELAQYEQDHRIEIIEKHERISKECRLNKVSRCNGTIKTRKTQDPKRMELEDLEFTKLQQQDLLDRMANSSMSSEELIKQQQSQLTKRNSQRKRQLQQINNQLEQQFNQTNPLAKSNTKEDDSTKIPFTPFQGDREIHKKYQLLRIPQTIDEIMDIENASKGSYHDPYVFGLAKTKNTLALDGELLMCLNELWMKHLWD